MAKRNIILPGLLVAVALAFLLSPFASRSPDGLQKVAADAGFMHRAQGKTILRSPAPNYLLPWIENKTLAKALAGVTGTILTFGVIYLLGYFLIRRRPAATASRDKDP